MTAPIIIKTEERAYKNVEIDGVGFKVRNFGAGEQLRISQLQRMAEKMSKIDNPTPEQEGELLDAMTELLTLVKGIFDDGVGGKETEALFARLDLEQIKGIVEQVFGNGATAS